MNAYMRKTWDTALSILKPAKKKLERGLDIHRNAIVCDAYGFAPHSAIDADALKAGIEAGAPAAEVEEMIEELKMTGHVRDEKRRSAYKEAWEASGVTCVFQNAGEGTHAPLKNLLRLAHFTYVTDFMRDYVFKAVTPADIELAKQEQRHCLYFVNNGVSLSQSWDSVEDELRFIRIFFQLGVRMMHLTYQRRNMIGDGCGEPSNAGLSDFGKAVIREMNRVGVIVDVAHSGLRTSYEAAKVSAKPVVVSHSVCSAIREHCRAKTDEVIRAVADSGGYIGICCYPLFLGRGGDISAFLDHIDYVATKFGADHVAIGTDWVYMSPSEAEERGKAPHIKSRENWRSLWPAIPAAEAEKWNQERQLQSLAWTNWPLFTVGLVQRGYSDEDIRKIIGGNVLRVAREALR